MGILWVALASFGGGLATAFLGWIASGAPFAGRKFATSFIRALIAGAAFAVTYHLATAGIVSPLDIVVAFGAGAGIDVIGHRIAKIK